MYEEITVKDYIMNNNYEMVICYAIWYYKNSLIMRRDKHNEKEVDRNRCYKNTVCDTDFIFYDFWFLPIFFKTEFKWKK